MGDREVLDRRPDPLEDRRRRVQRLIGQEDQELVATLFELGHEVTSVLDLDQILED